MIFLSTPSARRATHLLAEVVLGEGISIHALREEGDAATRWCCCSAPYFYPRPPRGGRLGPVRMAMVNGQFLSTPSARRATEGPDVTLSADKFLSTPSARRATPDRSGEGRGRPISIHALREEGDRMPSPYSRKVLLISIHALREEGDSKNRDKISIFKQIIQHSARI